MCEFQSEGVTTVESRLACIELELEAEYEDGVGHEEEEPEAQAPPRHLLSQDEYQKNERYYSRG